MERVRLTVRAREQRGSKHARAVRAGGEIPGVMYSSRSEPVSIAVDARALRHAMTEGGGSHAILDVVLEGDGGARPAVIKELQLDPVRDRVIHLDLHEIRLDEPIASTVMVVLEGDPEGVNMGGTLNQTTRELNVTALPGDMPEQISVDVSGLAIGDTLRLADVSAPAGLTFTDDPEGTVIATVLAPISEEALEEALGETPAEGAEAEALEAAEAAAEEDAAAAGADEPSE